MKIPAGIRPGQVIRLAGQGQTQGARKSDLLLEIDYRPHGEFEVDGRNILYTLSLPPWEAALGTTAACRRWAARWTCGFRRIPIPAASCACADADFPASPRPGDQIVEIEVYAPRAETDAQRDLYRQMAEQFGGKAALGDPDQPGISRELMTSTSWSSVKGLVM